MTSHKTYILTPLAKRAILSELATQLEEMKYLKQQANTSAFTQGIEAEIRELKNQQSYYLDKTPQPEVGH